jgi:hypothetical protein
MDLSSLASGQTVITSLDLEPVNQIFACGALQVAQAGGFEISSQTVSPGQLQATATQLGEQSRVITALAYDANGNVFVVSYGWQSDATTVYSTQAVMIPSTSTDVATADSNAIIAAITNLAGHGYIITAMGGNAANGLLLVGARVIHASSPYRDFHNFAKSAGPSNQRASVPIWNRRGHHTRRRDSVFRTVALRRRTVPPDFWKLIDCRTCLKVDPALRPA